ncbi:MAG: phospho-N-acetylmuramoyl-pentapeptide-transferase [Phascolarctobacterium sp.]|nr:phospho-N-acetylmuramoyl-pentapeptide-transferase [Phascolarctobacterium sp.]
MLSLLWVPLAAFIVCAAIGPVLIPYLHKLKFGQMIREVGPKSHAKKSGTPTMGGIMILAGIVIALLCFGQLTPSVIIALVLTLGHAVIGFIDDYIKVVMKRNLGLTERQKFLLQFILAGAYVWYAEHYIQNTNLWFPGINVTVDFGMAYYVLAFILLVGTTNAVNLTDGLDGLVSFVTLPVALVYAVIAYGLNMPDMGQFALAVFGACCGFLLFNHYPAKVFMGDTGSLALGGAVAALALLTKTELLLVIIGGVYVAEASSVIMQVAYFKYTHGKRIFRMSPLHHHFELGGWNDVKWKETKVVKVFTLVSCLLCLAAYGLWNLR